jgi:PhnB protein
VNSLLHADIQAARPQSHVVEACTRGSRLNATTSRRCPHTRRSEEDEMAPVKSIPEGVQAVFPMLVCPNPEAEMNFCAAAFGAVEQVRRPGPDGSPVHIAMRINGAFLVAQSEFPDVTASRAPADDGSSPVVIFVYVADVDRAVECAVAVGARILMPAQDQFWGDRTARLLDPSGHVWTVASRIEDTTEQHRAKRWSEIRDR